MTQRAINWALALAIIIVWMLVQQLDGISAAQEQLDQEQAKADAIQAQDRDLRLQRAAYIACRDSLGEATPSWTTEGQLACTPKRGKPRAQNLTMAQVQP